MTVRRYLVTVTPGTATGYWNAMKRPMRARSSGSASVMSSPLKRTSPSVTSRLGWPMIALASVDLPEPFGPIRAWMRPFSTSRSSPLRICLPSAVTCRLRISSSAIRSPFLGPGRLEGAADGPFAFAWAGELDQIGERGAGKCLVDAALHPGPEQLRGAGMVAVDLMRALHLALPGDVEALHRSDLP